jgi:hypothetical protein
LLLFLCDGPSFRKSSYPERVEYLSSRFILGVFSLSTSIKVWIALPPWGSK